jgi:hypothetical protein
MEAAHQAPPSRHNLGEWQEVTRKKKLRKPTLARDPPPPSSRGKVPTDLIGLCFNCLSDHHVVKDCPNPSCCLCYRELGHHANQCRCHRLLPGGNAPCRAGRKRSRPSQRALRRSRSPASDATRTASSCSTQGGASPLKICASPSNSSPPQSSTPSPLGAPSHRSSVELCVLHQLEEVDREEQELGYALFAIMGGCRPVVPVGDVRHWLQVQFNIPGAKCATLASGPVQHSRC